MTAKPNIFARAVAEQVANNRSALGHQSSFASHRAHLTREIADRAPSGGTGRLVLLGAGNAFDVDLERLVDLFCEVHLVDIDPEAIEGARLRITAKTARTKVHLHAPVDLTGSWDRLNEWSRPGRAWESLAGEVEPTVDRVLSQLPGPFDVVVSCCMLTQLQLVVLDVLNDSHPAFDTLRTFVNAVHVRVLAGLLAEGGRGLLVTDLTSNDTYPLDLLDEGADLGKLMSDLVAAGNVIHAAHPGLLSAQIRRDPKLSQQFDVRFPVGPWLWRNGPERVFLVYGLEIRRAGG